MLLIAAEDGARSKAERILIKLLTDNSIKGWRANCPLGGYEVDVLFRAEKLVIEIDGFAFHTDAVDFQKDRTKQNAIALNGHQVLRFTWLDLTEYPDRVVAEITQTLRFRRAA